MMNKKIMKVLKIISIICILIILVESGFLIYRYFNTKEKKAYIDLVNAYDYNSSSYVTVGSNNNNDKSYEKAKITRYSKDLKKVWEKVYNKGYNGSFLNVKMDGTSYLAVGNYEASKEEHKNSIRTALFVKYSKDGDIEFEKEFQVLGNSKFTDVYVVEDGYLVTGQSIYENSTLGFSPDGGAFLIKYSKDGEVIWKKNYGGSKSGVYNSLLVKDNYIYTVGKNYARVGILSKYDMDGNLLKTTEYQFTDTFGFSGISVVGEHLVVVGGKKVVENENDYNTDALVVLYDLDGNYIREISYGKKGIERYNKVAVDSHNNIIAIGRVGNYDKKKSTDKKNVFTYDGIIGKYKGNLKEIQVEKYGDNMDDYFTDVKVINGKYLVSGYSSYEENSYLSKFVTYSDALKVLEVSS